MAVLQGLWLRKRLQRLIREERSRLYNRLPSKALEGMLDRGKNYGRGHPVNFKANVQAKMLEGLLVRWRLTVPVYKV